MLVYTCSARFCKQSTLLINYQVNSSEIHLRPSTNTEYPSSSFELHLIYLSNIPSFYLKFLSVPCLVLLRLSALFGLDPVTGAI
jgi:hypothetical protein